MESDQSDVTSAGRVARNGSGAPVSELERLHAKCRRQALVIETLTEAVSSFTNGARALKADNADLRAEVARLRGHLHLPVRTHEQVEGAELAEVAIPIGPLAPAGARDVIEQCLAGRVAASVLEDAQLISSELVTNSVCYSGAADDAEIVVRVHMWRDTCRIEVEDPGWLGDVAPTSPDRAHGTGMGLHLVQMLSERWGVVRSADGPTRVWAQLSCTHSLV
jgi:anti-sigma regulatory factor (Ser/Thr protein kinase)